MIRAVFENKNGRSFIYRSFVPGGGGYNYRTGRHLSSSSERGKLISNPDPVVLFTRVPRFLGPKGQDKSRAIVIERKNTEVAPNSLIPFPSLSWPLFGVLVAPSTRQRREKIRHNGLLSNPLAPVSWCLASLGLP